MYKSRNHRVPNKMNPKRPTTRHFIIKMQKVKDKERILKAARKKQLFVCKGAPIRLSADFSTETADQKGLARNIQSDERKARTHNQDYSLQELSFRIKG